MTLLLFYNWPIEQCCNFKYLSPVSISIHALLLFQNWPLYFYFELSFLSFFTWLYGVYWGFHCLVWATWCKHFTGTDELVLKKKKKCYSNLKRGQPKVVLPDNHIATFISSEIEHSFQMSLPLSGLHSIMFWLAFNDQIPKFTTLLLQITSKSTFTSNISEC